MSNNPLPISHLRAAINAQLALWDALRALEHAAGAREAPSWDDIVQELAIGCDESTDELTDEILVEALAELNSPPTTSFR